MNRLQLHLVRRIPSLVKLAWKMEKEAARTPEQKTRIEIMRPAINPIFNNSRLDAEWLQEYFVSGEDLHPFILFLKKVQEENNVPQLNLTVRYVAQDTASEMGYARGGDRFAIVMFFNQHLDDASIEKTKYWVQRVNNWLADYGGAYYMPYAEFDTPEQLKGCYPNIEHVVELKKKYDPDNLFLNGKWSRIQEMVKVT